MNDRTDNDAALPFAATGVRLAYTLNNTQPVRCTYISEEPLFYMDDMMNGEEAPSDDYFADDMSFEFDDLRSASGAFEMADMTEQLFAEQFATKTVSTCTLDEAMAIMSQSRMGAELLAFAAAQKIDITVIDQMAPISYDRMLGAITMRPNLSAHEQILLLTRELRRVWQHRQGALLHPLLFHPDHAIVINRVQSADLSAMMVRVAWELRLAGEHFVWDYLDQNGYHDLTRSMAREALADFRSLSDGRAQASVFESWFLSERCRSFDRTLIQQMLADYQGYVFKAGHEETSKVLTHQLIAALGAMPFGKNYLAPHASVILGDPIFTDVRDRANANFLWFIKFEQSFRQTERDLQGDVTDQSSLSSMDPSAHAFTSAKIIQWPLQVGALSTTKRILSKPETAGTIVDLHGWRSRSATD